MSGTLVIALMVRLTSSLVAGSFNAALIPFTWKCENEAPLRLSGFSLGRLATLALLLTTTLCLILLGPVICHFVFWFWPKVMLTTGYSTVGCCPGISGVAENWDSVLNAGQRFGRSGARPRHAAPDHNRRPQPARCDCGIEALAIAHCGLVLPPGRARLAWRAGVNLLPHWHASTLP